MSELKNKVGELKSENDYQLRLKDMNYGEKIKEMKDTHTQEMEALRAQHEVSGAHCGSVCGWHVVMIAIVIIRCVVCDCNIIVVIITLFPPESTS